MFKRLLTLMTVLFMIFALAIPAFGEGMTENGRNSIILDSGEFIAEESPDPEQSARNLEEAVALGILSEEMAKRPNDPAMEKDIPGMLQPVFVHGYDHESVYLQQMANCAEEGRIASRFWFAMGIYYSYCEVYYGKTVDDAWAFMDEMDRNPPVFPFANFESSGFGVVRSNSIVNNSEREGIIGGGTVWDLCTDADVIFKGYEWGLTGRHDFGDVYATQVAYALYDRLSGEKVLDICEDLQWHPERKMSIRQAAEAALRYWHFFGDPDEKVAYADAGTYDETIITRELLEKTITLPANSCESLPASWHGTLLNNKWSWVTASATGFNRDRVYREDDVRILKDAGLNVARLLVSFSWLQAPDVIQGQVNETRLKELDHLLALCMEKDIHLMIACSQYQGFGEYEDFGPVKEKSSLGPKTDAEISEFAEFWRMLARRYAAIPNEYLSFNLYNELSTDQELEYDRILGPAVDAIRAESPERTIIADIHTPGLTGECMAKRGVALSYHLYDPMSLCYINELDENKQNDPDFLHNVTWPYTEDDGITYDAKKLMDTALHYADRATSVHALKAVADQYNVGMMVGEFGVFGEYKGGCSVYRYTDETLFGYYRDVITTLESEGMGWILGPGDGTWGLRNIYPAVEDTEYEKIGYYYVDVKMRDFLKSFEK